MTAHFTDGSQAKRRTPGRRGWHPLDRARAVPAAGDTRVCGLSRVARTRRRERGERETRRALSDRMGFCLPPGEQMLTYLVAGRNNSTQPGERRFNFVWYRPAHEQTELRELFTDAKGRYYEQNIPPDRIRPQVIADMHATAARLLAPVFVDVIKATSEPLFQPIYDLQSADLAFGRVALLGDAAFVARPHVGLA